MYLPIIFRNWFEVGIIHCVLRISYELPQENPANRLSILKVLLGFTSFHGTFSALSAVKDNSWYPVFLLCVANGYYV